MSAADLLPLWHPRAEADANCRSPTPGGWYRLTMKEYTTWHTRISNLIFFFVLLGTGAILGVVTTLNAVGYLNNPESGFLSTSLTSFPPHLDVQSIASVPSELQVPILLALLNTSTASPASDVQRVNHPDEDTELGSNLVTTNSSENYDAYEERREVYSGNSSNYLSLHPVNLATLSDVYHDMSEAELLWRASASSLRRPRPPSVTPKVAFMFLTRGPLPLAPLWERYFRGHQSLYSIYIHAHPRFHPNFPPDSVFYRRNIPSKEVYWGKLSVFAAERRLLANALLDAANERFVLLSESCIPITSLPVAYKYYVESQHSFVDAFVDMGRGGAGRYNRIKHTRKLNPEITLEQWRKGSQWFEMSRELALIVVSDRKYYPKFEDFLCKNDGICYIDEHYLPTVLTILAASTLANRTTTFIDFSRNTAHPYQWEPEVINEATLKKITDGHTCIHNGEQTTTCHMFARKFNPMTIELLLQLASTSFGIP